jgi:hypothetical protein
MTCCFPRERFRFRRQPRWLPYNAHASLGSEIGAGLGPQPSALTFTGVRCQIRSEYSRIARSDEK